MLRRTSIAFPLMQCKFDEQNHLHRRIAPEPTLPVMIARRKELQERFRDVGPSYDRVWIHLGGRFRRRRIGRDQDRKDLRYYWKPLQSGYHRIYMQEFRRSLDEEVEPPRLFPAADEQGHVTSRPEFDRALQQGTLQKYGGKYATELPHDWEFRVY